MTCPKCADILAKPAADLVYIWQPGMDDAAVQEMGERVRTEAILLHAQSGHLLDPKEYPSRPWWRFW